MIKRVLTPKQVALAIGVSEASLKRWCDKGLLPAARTAGGHRRLPISGVFAFLRSSGHQIVRPDILGLPSTTGQGEVTLDRSRQRLQEAMEKGDEDQVVRIVFGLYLAGHNVCDICDKVFAVNFRDLGHRWEDGTVQVYQERRSCEIVNRVLYQLREALAHPAASAPRAIGATLEYDPYTLATSMVAVTLREAGWNAESYGTGNPADTLCRAIIDMRPRLFWLSASTIRSEEEFVRDCAKLYETTHATGTALVLGGRALTEPIRHQIQYSAYCDNLTHLLAFVRTLNVKFDPPDKPADFQDFVGENAE